MTYKLKKLFNSSRQFIQRGRRGYSDEDLHDLDQYLLSWLPGAIEKISRYNHEFAEDKDEMIRKLKLGKELNFEQFIEDHKFNKKKFRARKKEFEEGIDLFKKHFLKFWY